MTVIRATVGAMADPGNLRAGASRVEYTKPTPRACGLLVSERRREIAHIAHHLVAVSHSCLRGGPRGRRADRQYEAHQQFAGVGAVPDNVAA